MISLITTLYNSEKYLKDFTINISSELKKITNDYEVIIVDDGSTDNTVGILKKIAAVNPKFKIILLSKNFGQMSAYWCGLKHSKGEYIMFMEADGEISSDNINRFYTTMVSDTNYDCIYGFIKDSDEYTRPFFSKIFNNLIYYLTGSKNQKNQSFNRIFTKQFKEELLKFNVKEQYVVGLFALTGFNQKGINLEKKSKGYTQYDFIKKMSIAFNIITSFSHIPLLVVLIIGLTISTISFFAIIFYFISSMFIDYQNGWPSLLLTILLIGGLLNFSLGVVGIYLSRVLSFLKQRPDYIIKEKINFT
jgi:putative glycosyltransferase